MTLLIYPYWLYIYTARTEGVKFVMIKYPRRTLRLPQEQQFKIDANNKVYIYAVNELALI